MPVCEQLRGACSATAREYGSNEQGARVREQQNRRERTERTVLRLLRSPKAVVRGIARVPATEYGGGVGEAPSSCVNRDCSGFVIARSLMVWEDPITIAPSRCGGLTLYT